MKPAVLLIALAALASAGAHAEGDAGNGQKLFTRLCGGCHKAGPDARNSFGPQLNGVVGRAAGSLPDYSYSPAMKAAGFTWDEPRLKAFLNEPGDVVKGTKMYFWGVSDDDKLNDLLAFLRATAGQ
ncbi:c-type cytochrome [Pseudomonas sp. NPDC007930]|uniref:c-type cytochrome n=1 Tax=Pseudomonas sp. NPDC007930 TaxID=3364417 RepID=UPI0036E89429